jgi:hypothetical protein
LSATATGGLTALSELRQARKANRLQGLPWGETLYRVYLIVVGLGGIVWWLATILGDRQVSSSAVADVRRVGPSVVGLVLAAVLGNALRSGARGASLTIEPADVSHVLAAPLPRARVLRRPAVHSLRRGLVSALLVGFSAGALTAPFLPGGPFRWTVLGAGVAATLGLGASAVGLIAGGRRLPPRLALAISTAMLGWSLADVLTEKRTSPLSYLGAAALLPLSNPPALASHSALAALVGTVVLVVLALAGLGGVGIEAAERRARLVSQLRFAVTTQDLRAVVLLRRQLASERARRRPWFAVKGRSGPGGAVVTRGLRSIARWPVARAARVAILAIAAGIALRLSYEGTLPLVLISALCFFVMGLDLVEPLAQDADRPDLLKSFPRHRGRLANRQLIVPAFVASLFGLLAGAAAIVTGVVGTSTVGPSAETALAVVVAALCGAVAGTLAAAVNAAQGPPSIATMLSTPELAFMRTSLPVIVTVVGTVAPLLSARVAALNAKTPSVYPGVVRGLLVVALIVYGMVLWITDGGIREPK